MTTYAEQQGEQPFDWRAALANPPERFSLDHLDLIKRAVDWVTCACGNRCAVLPRFLHGQPKDHELAGLGVQFSDDVNAANWNSAYQTLEQIEARSAYLLSQMEEAK